MLTPVEGLTLDWGTIMVKRDDLYIGPGGAIGGKARTCAAIAQGAKGLTTACGRSSPQAHIVARVGHALNIPVRIHTPSGKPGSEIDAAIEHGATRVIQSPGHTNVLTSRAKQDATQRDWTYVPFGMETTEAVWQTAGQLGNVSHFTERIVIPIGSGMSAAGIVMGLRMRSLSTKVLGVIVGSDPYKRLDYFAPGWRSTMNVVNSGMDYHKQPDQTRIADLELDGVYEAKCIPFLQDGDLLWIVGKRMTDGH